MFFTYNLLMNGTTRLIYLSNNNHGEWRKFYEVMLGTYRTYLQSCASYLKHFAHL